jgi:hypothetical protein
VECTEYILRTSKNLKGDLKMSRKVKKNGVMQSVTLDKNKKYKYSATGDLVESTGTLGDNEISISGSKSSLRRAADMERNISILATTMLTTDNGSGPDSPAQVKADAATDATTKANAAQAAAISAASSDATTKANAAQAAAISAVTNGAGAAFDTLVEIQNAMATDSELSSAISSVTSSAASTAAADATTKANAAVASAESKDVTRASAASSDATTKADAALAAAKVYADNGDANTTYTAGNGMTLSGTSFLMSGSYTGNFTATGDITAYSDDTLKTNVQLIDGALGRVQAIRGVTFDRISDGSTSTGVIAQELKAVLPEAVHTDANGVHSVAYGNITGLLIEAVKELSDQVNSLKK